MPEKSTFGVDVDVIKKSFSDIFSGRVLAWQLGGTILAALCMSVTMSIPTGQSRFASFILACLGLVLVYVVLSATGCIVARLLSTSADDGDGVDTGVAPLHFLIDNIGTATLLPLICSGAAVVLAVALYLLSMPAGDNVWQTILIVFSPIALIIAAVTVFKLFVLLFLVPSMIVSEQPPLSYSLRKLWRIGWARKTAVAQTYGTGLMVSMLVVLPATLILVTAAALCVWAHCEAASAPPSAEFAWFMMRLYGFSLICAPVWAVALAFLNALAVNTYGDLVEDLDLEEEAAVAEENGTSPSGGEDAGLDVEGEEETAATEEEPAN